MLEKFEKANYYIGTEIEKTPAYGNKTLYVVGARSLTYILEYAEEYKCKHVRIGANGSWKRHKSLTEILTALFAKNIQVSIEYPLVDHDYVTDLLGGLMNSHLLIPIINMHIPNIQNIGNNLTIKVTDNNEQKSNIGVWCTNASALAQSNQMTHWAEYDGLEIIEYRDNNGKKIENNRLSDKTIPSTPNMDELKQNAQDTVNEDKQKGLIDVLNAYIKG